MITTVVDFAKDQVIYDIAGCTRNELDNKLDQFFNSEGYTLKTSTESIHTYTKGNRVMRLLLGAFVKYNKQSVLIKNEDSRFSVKLHKDSSGMSGGLIGMNQVKKEFVRLNEAFKMYFS